MASLAIQTDNDPDILRSTLLGDTTGLSNFVVTPIGDSRAFGAFGGDALSENSFYLNSGIVLSTGRVADIAGVNTGDGGSIATGSNDLSTDFGAVGANGDSISLRIDFDADATKDKLFFQYVFGSEEFIEYVNLFNDSFSLSLNGINIAKLPNGDAVNIDNLAASSALPPGYFIYNSATDGPNRTQTKLDGYSIPITFEGNLIKNARNTLVINVQDNRDGILDSAVFLKGGTLGTTRPSDIAVPLTNLPPDAANATITIFPNTTVNLTGLSASDPDGTVVSYTITSLPIAGQGTLYLNDPATGGTPITTGQVLTPAQINRLFFQAASSFRGNSFTYTATDNAGATDTIPATVTLTANSTPPDECPPGINLKGTNKKDTLNGTAGSDQLQGLRGNDVLYGGGCDDNLQGNQDNDRLFGGSGDNILNGGLGSDELYGGKGNDILYGRRGEDILKGGTGDDRLSGGRNNDILRGGSGNDILRGRQNDDFLYGGSGDDRLSGGLGKDKLFGGNGDDRLAGRRGNDVLRGRAGNDFLRGFRGKDNLFGGDGRDRLIGNLGNDVLVGGLKSDLLTGGAGRDRFVYGSVEERGDRITDFKIGRDTIDLHRIFTGDRYSDSNRFGKYIKLAQAGSNTIVRVDFNGDNQGGFKALMALENIEIINLTTKSFRV